MNVVNTEYVPACPITSIRKHPDNRRQGDVGAIHTSIEENGFYGAIVVQVSSGFVLAGNHRLDAAVYAGADSVPVIFVDCDDRQALRILLADNRTNDLADYDSAGLAELLQQVHRDSGTLLGTGYDDEALRNIMRDLEGYVPNVAPEAGGSTSIPATEVSNDPREDGPASTRYKETESSAADAIADEVVDKRDALVEKWQTAAGQIWQLGPHRLMIGDSTKAEDLDALLAGAVPTWCWTDPPYGVSYVGKTKAAMTLSNDGAEDLDALLAGVFAQLVRLMKPGAPIYVAHPHGPKSATFANEFLRAGFHWHQTLVWVKNSIVLGHSDYHYRHEPILYGWTPKNDKDAWPDSMYPNHPWHGERNKSTVLEFPKPSRSDLHPTTKPTALITHCLLNSSAPGAIGIEPFGGSGSTLVAANECNRIAYVMELDPKFGAVIVERASLAGLSCEKVSG